MANAIQEPLVAKKASALIDINEFAEIANCSTRHIIRLADAGKLPKPVRIGRLVRWRRSDVDAWLEAGCPACSTCR